MTASSPRNELQAHVMTIRASPRGGLSATRWYARDIDAALGSRALSYSDESLDG
jgi:hypothetical protein